MPLILPGNVASATASTTYDVDNSVRFNFADSPRLHKTPASDGNRKTFTFSWWLKRCSFGSYQPIFEAGGNWVDFKNDDTFRVGINATGGSSTHRVTNRVFRDCSAWYHIVVRVDTTQGTAANRLRIYVNGVEETSMGTSADVTQDADTDVNYDSAVQDILQDGSSRHFDGYAAEIVLLDGTSAAPTEFGEFDEDSPTIWKPKKVSGLNFGTNGFYLDFKDSANLGNDASGGTDLTEVNLDATDQTTDTPTNNFATANPLMSNAEGFAEGNLYVTDRASTDASYGACSSMGVRKGKWYMEFYMVSTGASTNLGAMPETSSMTTAGDYQYQTNNFMYRSTNGNALLGNGTPSPSGGSYGDSYTSDDIISVALDMDNQDIYFYKNGAIQDSGTAAFTSSDFVDDTFYFFYQAGYNTGIVEYNFGNPIRTISSGNADANGYGNFEYAVPNGYYALCTKNLAEFG